MYEAVQLNILEKVNQAGLNRLNCMRRHIPLLYLNKKKFVNKIFNLY